MDNGNQSSGKISVLQWISSCFSLSVVNPIVLSAYIYVATATFLFYVEAMFESDGISAWSGRFLHQTFHDRVYTSVAFVAQNIFFYGICNMIMSVAEFYAGAVFKKDESYRPFDSDEMVLDSSKLLNMSIRDVYQFVLSWITSLMSPFRMVSTVSMLMSFACKRVMLVLFWVITVSYVCLMARSLHGMEYGLLPSSDSMLFGGFLSYVSDMWNMQNPLIRRILGV